MEAITAAKVSEALGLEKITFKQPRIGYFNAETTISHRPSRAAMNAMQKKFEESLGNRFRLSSEVKVSTTPQSSTYNLVIEMATLMKMIGQYNGPLPRKERCLHTLKINIIFNLYR